SGSVLGGAPSPESSCRRFSCSVSGDWCCFSGSVLVLCLSLLLGGGGGDISGGCRCF
ncbi:hypothetical protein A2U01_0077353, partial [Trifolium medium]|nr:hypothetical protein [Trifolium medium]